MEETDDRKNSNADKRETAVSRDSSSAGKRRDTVSASDVLSIDPAQTFPPYVMEPDVWA